MEKSIEYNRTRFSADVLREAIQKFHDETNPKNEKSNLFLTVEVSGAEWTHDSKDEFFADYRRSSGTAFYRENIEKASLGMRVILDTTTVEVRALERKQIEAVFEVFEKHLASSRLPSPPKPLLPKPRIFIGHGNSEQWRDLKDHLHDQHGYDVEAYEIGARAGHAVRDILEDMLSKSSFALLVLTGEDKDEDGKLRARQNVIHELGLFQGKLGFSRAIILLEEGTEEFSNIQGIHQIRYGKKNIKETYGEILATLKREFD